MISGRECRQNKFVFFWLRMPSTIQNRIGAILDSIWSNITDNNYVDEASTRGAIVIS